ncbi:MAG: GntR family transcriptional regulator [Candidatus Tenebribacter mawsonii]|nr:GntR family transcriptional regulator [Candidatus Tenebribacter mawsonii]
MSKLPAYIRVQNEIKDMILKGEFSIGSLLPAEPELEIKYDVSRTTVRKAVEKLVQAGFVDVKQGRGTMVLDYNVNQNISNITSISQTLANKGFVVRPRKIYLDYINASSSVAKALEIEEGRQLIRLQRVQLADEVPIAIMENYINPEMVQRIEQFSENFTSLYKILETDFNIHLEGSIDKITAKVADFPESEMLQIPYGAALLLMRRVTYSNKVPISYDYLKIRADKYQFEIDMKGIKKDF